MKPHHLALWVLFLLCYCIQESEATAIGHVSQLESPPLITMNNGTSVFPAAATSGNDVEDPEPMPCLDYTSETTGQTVNPVTETRPSTVKCSATGYPAFTLSWCRVVGTTCRPVQNGHIRNSTADGGDPYAHSSSLPLTVSYSYLPLDLAAVTFRCVIQSPIGISRHHDFTVTAPDSHVVSVAGYRIEGQSLRSLPNKAASSWDCLRQCYDASAECTTVAFQEREGELTGNCLLFGRGSKMFFYPADSWSVHARTTRAFATMWNTDYYHGDVWYDRPRNKSAVADPVSSGEACKQLCEVHPRCIAASYYFYTKSCWLKDSIAGPGNSTHFLSYVLK